MSGPKKIMPTTRIKRSKRIRRRRKDTQEDLKRYAAFYKLSHLVRVRVRVRLGLG
jgi:hypothetical protein